MRHSAGAFVSLGEAAERIGVARKTVQRWCESGQLPAIPKAYGTKTTYLVSSKTIEELIKSRDEAEQQKVKRTQQKVKRNQSHHALLPAWLESMERGTLNGRVFSPRTVETYQLYSDKFFQRFNDLNANTLEKELASIPTKQFAKREKVFKTLVCLAKFLIREGCLSDKFLDEVKPLTPKRHKPAKRTTVNEEGLERLYAACESKLDILIVTLIAFTGLRATEACELRLSDLELEKGILTVQCGKGGKSRKVGLAGNVVDTIRFYLESRPQSKASDYLLKGRTGKQMDRYGLRQRIERISGKAGVQATPHALRRAFVTLNANKGRSLVMLQMACGHSDIATTRSYCMTAEQEVIEAMKGWE